MPANTLLGATKEGRSFQGSLVLLVRTITMCFEFITELSILGCAIVMKDEALLFTDGRYFLQAESQLDKLVAFSSRESH
jgi:hypothetical protein